MEVLTIKNMKNFKRHGDINLYPITKEEYEKIQSDIINHNGNFVIQEGETTGHKHLLTVEKTDFLEIKKMPNGLYAFITKENAMLTHEDHKQLTIPKETYYIEVREREVDNFADFTIRQVID